MRMIRRCYSRARTIEERFWDMVDKQGSSECWNWEGSTDGKGYGKFLVNGTFTRAHRFAYEITYGPIKEGKLVLHKCNSKGCVNPLHLYIGDQVDNMRDLWTTGYIRLKLYPGERWLAAKLHSSGKLTYVQIAKMFKVTASGICDMIKRHNKGLNT